MRVESPCIAHSAMTAAWTGPATQEGAWRRRAYDRPPHANARIPAPAGHRLLIYDPARREGDGHAWSSRLVLFEQALALFRANLPHVFILENTAALLTRPLVLLRIVTALQPLPYTWRWPLSP